VVETVPSVQDLAGLDNLFAVVEAAFAANAVGQLRLIALRAHRDGGCSELVAGAARVRLRAAGLSLRDSHVVRSLFRSSTPQVGGVSIVSRSLVRIARAEMIARHDARV